MRPQVILATVALALPLAGVPGSTVSAQGRIRFAAMDANNDGRITRDEWRGSENSFRVHDWNGDGVLSGDEVRPGARRRAGAREDDFQPDRLVLRDWSPARFRSLDRNGDGRITRDEWFYDPEGFVRADRNRDGVLTRAEFLGGDFDDDRDDAFEDVDHDHNGRIDRNEWHGSREAFDWMDRNRDGVLERSEVVGDVPPHDSDLFGSLDTNRNGVIDRSEWQWSSVSFNGRDRNRDGVLSRDELGAATSSQAPEAPVGTSGRVITVDARERWTDTGIYLRAGDIISFQAEGTIQMSSNAADTATPSGSSSGRRAPNAPLSDHPAGGLIARIGNSEPVYVGDRGTRLRAPVSGQLFVGVNDDYLADNSGQFRINVTIQR